jgi:hypothetical protein
MVRDGSRCETSSQSAFAALGRSARANQGEQERCGTADCGGSGVREGTNLRPETQVIRHPHTRRSRRPLIRRCPQPAETPRRQTAASAGTRAITAGRPADVAPGRDGWGLPSQLAVAQRRDPAPYARLIEPSTPWGSSSPRPPRTLPPPCGWKRGGDTATTRAPNRAQSPAAPARREAG